MLSAFLTFFFQTIKHMRDCKHQRFVMHIIKNVLICQNLQTGGKVLIRFPETQGQGKKRKQCKFITYISFFIFLPPSFSQARASLFIFPSKYCCPFIREMTVLLGITKHIIYGHDFIIICLFFSPVHTEKIRLPYGFSSFHS